MRSAGRSLFVIGLCAVSLAAADTDISFASAPHADAKIMASARVRPIE